jgi:phytoene synthase
MMRTGSRSFSAAAHLLPRRIREPATALYAFCRLADDLVDDGTGQSDALAELRHRLERAYSGDPCDHPADRAFAHTVAAYAVPRELPSALLEGFAWDIEGRRYQTFDDLLDYAARVAGAVGAMMAVLMGVRTPNALARACDLGTAMQLTNIARDVGEDASANRLYLPLDCLEEAGISPDDFLRNPAFTPALAGVVARLLDAADALYARGLQGATALPIACQPGIRAAALLYREIGRAVAIAGHDSVTSRACVPASRKATLLARALVPALTSSAQLRISALPACQFLVDAAAHETPAQAAPGIAARAVWVFDLFERLQAQQMEMS